MNNETFAGLLQFVIFDVYNIRIAIPQRSIKQGINKLFYIIIYPYLFAKYFTAILC